ncbi:MAG: heterodisulfide reductase-related iron-sulfur binding cluster [Candidatus Alcyoniella australis]|nr:heterodisulfide reductase-related iron-sulfur binding cluster [Candidatus Alcyoniella australis]
MKERLAFWEIYQGYGWTRWFVYGLALVTMAIFAYGVWTKVKLWRAGTKSEKPRLDQMGARIVNLLKYALVQIKVFKEAYPGIMHACIFFGFVVLFIGTAATVLDEDLYRLITGSKFIQGGFYVAFSFFLDLFGVLAIIGLGMAAWRRYVTKPDRLDNRSDDAVVLGLIALILVTGFLSEAGRIANGLLVAPGTQLTTHGINPDYASFEPLASPVGYLLALGLKGLGVGGTAAFHKVIWFLHLFLGLGFIAVIPYTKLWHIVASSANIYSSNLELDGAVVPIDNLIEKMENDQIERLGYDRIADFTPKQLVMLDACTRCGRCQEVCPAYNTEKPLSPKQFIQDFKIYWDAKCKAEAAKSVEGEGEEKAADDEYDPEPFLNDVVKPDVVWSCTTCMACMEACPVMIEHLSLMNEVRRALVFNMIMPAEGSNFLKNMTNNMNPWGMNPGDRIGWAEGLDIPLASDGDFDVLLWVGCMGAYDARAQKVSQSLVKIMRQAGIKFAVIGNDESCCGDSSRRLGEEGLFQMIAMQNVEIMNELGVKKIVTTCPHGYNTLKHEYPKLGGEYEVKHHTEFIAELIQGGKIKLKNNGFSGKNLVFHDSCYLGRYNDLYDEPRQVLAAVPGLKTTEIERSRNKAFCCGGGGGLMWLEEHAPKINVTRVEQMMEAKPDVLCSACPFCLTMFDEAYKLKGYDEQGVELFDLAEVVAKSLDE